MKWFKKIQSKLRPKKRIVFDLETTNDLYDLEVVDLKSDPGFSDAHLPYFSREERVVRREIDELNNEIQRIRLQQMSLEIPQIVINDNYILDLLLGIKEHPKPEPERTFIKSKWKKNTE